MARVKVPGGFSGKPAYMGAGVGESSHWVCAPTPPAESCPAAPSPTTRPTSAGRPEGAPVAAGLRGNMGALVLRTARSCGFPVAYLPGRAEHDPAPRPPSGLPHAGVCPAPEPHGPSATAAAARPSPNTDVH